MDGERLEEIQQLAEMLSRVTDEVTKKKIIGFLSMIGREYSGQLMVVGRAPNTWKVEGRYPNGLCSDAHRLEYARLVYESVTDKECPIALVTKQTEISTRSAFWRVIRAVVSRLKIADVDDDERPWSSYLVWSNLYKIAPCDGGNPIGKLQKAQLDRCVKLLHWELEHYQPRRILFVTGDWADRFLEEAWADRTVPNAQSFVEAVGRLKCGQHMATCVVAARPERKIETIWVNDVVNAFGCGSP